MIGLDALTHMAFLFLAPERVLALRLALSRVIRPTSVVLDAGCGALGVLAILAAKLGASRVVGVDLGALDQAKALAEENGVANRVQFIQGDLQDIDLPIKNFDVIIGMIYNNEPRLDFVQQKLMESLIDRFGHSQTIVVPSKVRYTVAGYNDGIRDHSNWTRRIEWETRIQNVERQTGITFADLRHLLDQTGETELWADRSRSSLRCSLRGWRHDGRRVSQHVQWLQSPRTLLTHHKVFTESDYAARTKKFDYPQSVSLPVVQRGQLNIVVFQREIMFDELLIQAREGRSFVCTPQRVGPNDVVILSTGEEWKRCIPLAIERKLGYPNSN